MGRVDVEEQLDAVVAALGDACGRDLVAAYLHGSAVGAGLRPASDVDVLAVLAAPLAPAARARLTASLLRVSGRRVGARPLELVAVVADEVRPWRHPPPCDFLYGEWLRAEAEAGPLPRPGPTPDLAVLLHAVHRAGVPLVGPAPEALLDPVPPADLRRATLDGLTPLLADLEDDTRNVLLTLARVWVTAATGRVVDKDAAATWALERLPEDLRPPLARARELYRSTSYADETWDPAVRAGARRTAEGLSDRARSAG